MKFSFFMLISVVLFPVLGVAGTYQIDTHQSAVYWKATKVTGAHEGEVGVKSGSIRFEDGHFVGGNAVVDMTTITISDLKNEGMNKKLLRHLQSDDFFDIEKYPEAKISITEVQPLNDHQYSILADMSIKEITKQIQFVATVKLTETEVIADAEVVIDRTDFDIKYGSGKFFENLGDKMIHDQFTLKINIKASNK